MPSQFLKLQMDLDRQQSWTDQLDKEFNRLGSPDFQPMLEMPEFNHYGTVEHFVKTMQKNGRDDLIAYQMKVIKVCLKRLDATLGLIDVQNQLARAAPQTAGLDDTIKADHRTFALFFGEAIQAKQVLDEKDLIERNASVELSKAFGKASERLVGLQAGSVSSDAAPKVDALLRGVFKQRFRIVDSELDMMTLRTEKIWNNLRQAIYIQKSLDERIVEPVNYVIDELTNRYTETNSLLDRQQAALTSVNAFKSRLQEMGDDDFSRRKFSVRRYVPVSAAMLCENQP